MMKKLLSSVAIASLILLSSFAVLATPVQAASPTVKLATLPGCTTQTGLFWDSTSNIAWQPCYDTGILYKEDFSTSPATLTSYDISGTMGTFNEIAIWGDTSNLYNIGRGIGGAFAGIAQSTKADPLTLTTPVSGLAADVFYPTELNGHLFVPYDGGVVDYDTSAGTHVLVSTGQQMFQCANDGTSVYCTAQLANQLYQIDPATDTATLRYSGMTEPYGVAAGSGYVYVAQHGGNTVLKVSASTWTLAGTATLPVGATPYGVALYGNYVLTDGSGSSQSVRNLYVVSQSNMNVAATVSCPVSESGQCRPLYALAVDQASGDAYVGFQGSAGAAQISNWQASISSTTSSSSTTTTTTSTATASGGNAVYIPQTLPVIHVSSTGIGGQPNIYITHDGSVSLYGYEYFEQGGTVGSFKNFTWNLPSKVLGPEPACSLLPYLPFCKTVASPLNPVHIDSPVFSAYICDGGAPALHASYCPSAIPVYIQGFDLFVSGLPLGETTITLTATGTDSGSQGFVYNIFVYNVGS